MSQQKYPQTTVSTSADGTKSARKGREHYSHTKADARKSLRRDQAEDRQAKYDALSLKEKLASLVPDGSKRQRARLEAKLAAAKTAAVKQAPLTEAQKGAKAVKRAQDAVAALPVTKK